MQSILRRTIPRLSDLKCVIGKYSVNFQLCYSCEKRLFTGVSYPLALNLGKETRRLCSQSFVMKYKVFDETCKQFSTLAQSDVMEEQTSSTKAGKRFFEWENEHFHSYLENNKNYCETIHKNNTTIDIDVTEEEIKRILDKDCWIKEDVQVYYESFVKAAKYSTKSSLCISDPVFKKLCDAFQSKCNYFSDDQLVNIFVCLQNWPGSPNVRDENFLKVWKMLDSVCLLRRMSWNYKRTLYMIDLWYSLKLTRLSLFVRKSIFRCIDKAKRLVWITLIVYYLC